jgi:hypothetical protein
MSSAILGAASVINVPIKQGDLDGEDRSSSARKLTGYTRYRPDSGNVTELGVTGHTRTA